MITDEIIASFIQQAQQCGLKLNGVNAKQIPGRGVGVVANRSIKAGEVLVHVPTDLLLRIDCIPDSFKALHASISVHGLMASFLTSGPWEYLDLLPLWEATWPSYDDFQTSMPSLWEFASESENKGESADPGALSWPLPPAVDGNWSLPGKRSIQRQIRPTQSHVQRQREKIEADWSIVSSLEDTNRKRFVRNWLVVNTRSFYYNLPLQRKTYCPDYNMILCPFMDFFNHANSGCRASFDQDGYTITSDRDYDQDEEIKVSYGAHDNDFLMAECSTSVDIECIGTDTLPDGFILDENESDRIPLDSILLDREIGIKATYVPRLKFNGYYGDYSLYRSGICHRTEVALEAQNMSYLDWKKSLRGDMPHGVMAVESEKVKATIKEKILPLLVETAKRAQEQWQRENSHSGLNRYAVSMVLNRWRQIDILLRSVQF